MLKLQIVLLFSMTVVQIFVLVTGSDCLVASTFTIGGPSAEQSQFNQSESKQSESKQSESKHSESKQSESKHSSPMQVAFNSDALVDHLARGAIGPNNTEETQEQNKGTNKNKTITTSKKLQRGAVTNSNYQQHEPGKQNDPITIPRTERNHNDSSSKTTIQEMSGSIGEGMGGCNNCNSCKKCRKNVYDMPIVPEICRKQFTACNDTIHFQADVNLMFKERGFWCKLKELVREAVEEGLDDRCELCRYNYVEKIVD